jgi:hypothetical protein
VITALAPLGAIPAYCTSGAGVRTPAQWQYCVKLGWQEPTTGAANAASALGGHGAVPGGVIAAVVVIALILLALRLLLGRRSTATAS